MAVGELGSNNPFLPPRDSAPGPRALRGPRRRLRRKPQSATARAAGLCDAHHPAASHDATSARAGGPSARAPTVSTT